MINLKNPATGYVKQVPVGFSWTMLLFGIFVPLFRGDFKYFLITLVLAIITGGISWFIFPFFYNKMYKDNNTFQLFFFKIYSITFKYLFTIFVSRNKSLF